MDNKTYFDLNKECNELIVKIADENCKIESNNNKENSVNQLKEIKEKIKALVDKKNEISMAIVGQMAKGKITENLSLRKGEFHFKNRRRSTNLYRAKEEIIENIHQVKDKVTANNFDILDFILQRVYEDERIEEYADNLSSGKEKFVVDFEERSILLSRYDYNIENSQNEFELIKVNCILLENGYLYLAYKYKDNDNDEVRIDSYGKSNALAILPIFVKEYEKELKVKITEEIQFYQKEVDRLEKEINDIKTKGQNLYMLYELNKGNTAQ
jgi:hypothetical protein